MEIERFSRRMIELLPQMVRGFARYEHNSLSRGEISLPQLWALEVLSRSDACPMNALARYLRISRSAATGLIDRLILQGFARRHHDDKDRRVVRVVITPKGRKTVTDIWEQKRGLIVRMFGRIRSEERARYLATLEKVVGMLEGEDAES